MAEVVICELLCYVQHYIDKCPKENIVSSVSSFYTVSEVEAAKAVMADIVGDTEAARRRAGPGKRKLDVEDILSMYESHDKTGATAMPTFAAVKLKRLPVVSPSEVDVCALAANVTDLQYQMQKVTEAITKLADVQTKVPPTAPTPAETTELHQECTEVKISPVPARSWADRAASVPNVSTATPRAPQMDNEGFITVSHQRPAVKRALPTATGRKTGNSSIKAVPRPLVCFVGRLDINTTADSLAEFLADSGIVGAKCTKLEAKNGRTFKTAAFRVSCAVEYRDLFYNEFNWPDGADLRDWYDNSR